MNTSKNRVQPLRLSYHISGEEEIINHFSLEGFELLSSSFLSFIDLMCPPDPKQSPIILEITGAKLDEKKQKTIDDAIWLHYRLRMTRVAQSLKSCSVKILWFFIGTVLSSIFLYLVTQNTNEVETQFFYLPIWFFGYRLLTYPLQNYLPLRRELKQYRRLAAMKLIFTEKPVEDLSETMIDSACEENAVYYDEAMEGIRSAQLTKNFIREDGTVIISCFAESAKDLLNPCSTQTNQMISEDLASFLNQAEPFVNPDKNVELQICGNEISEEEKNTISFAVANYFKCRYQQALDDLSNDQRQIGGYTLGLIISCIVLYFCGTSVGLGMHEFMVIAMWFFGDYLIEFILIGLSDAKYTVRLRRRLMDMKIYLENKLQEG